MDTDTRRRILEEAHSWIGTPYWHKGRIKGLAVDCGMLIYEIYNPIYGPFPPPPDYPADWAMHADREIMLDFIAPFTREVKQPVAAGIAVFQFGRCYSHMAICTGGVRDWFIHSFGRNQIGSVKLDRVSFFKQKNGKLRKVKFFEPRD
jgi:cell wall-associated NlpC family hydrolase